MERSSQCAVGVSSLFEASLDLRQLEYATHQCATATKAKASPQKSPSRKYQAMAKNVNAEAMKQEKYLVNFGLSE